MPGAAVTILISATPGQVDVISNRARVAGNEIDPNLNDNSAGVDVTVSAATAADLAIYQTSEPDPARVVPRSLGRRIRHVRRTYHPALP